MSRCPCSSRQRCAASGSPPLASAGSPRGRGPPGARPPPAGSPTGAAHGPLQEKRLVSLLRHDRCRRSNPLVGTPVERERSSIPGRLGLKRNQLPVGVGKVDDIDLDRSGRLEPLKDGSNLTLGLVRDLLLDRLADRRDSDEHRATVRVEECAEGLARAVELPGRLLELQLFGLPSGDLALEVRQPHLKNRPSMTLHLLSRLRIKPHLVQKPRWFLLPPKVRFREGQGEGFLCARDGNEAGLGCRWSSRSARTRSGEAASRSPDA